MFNFNKKEIIENFDFKKPISQFAIIATTAILIMTLYKLVALLGWNHNEKQFYWTLGGTFVMFFAVANSVTSLNVKGDLSHYWQRSTAAFTFLALGLGALAWLYSGLSPREAGSILFILVVLTFGYLLLLSVMRLFRKIVNIAQREDNRWQQRARKNQQKK